METITIREIIEQVSRGQIRIPAFQRGFVWEPDRVAFLIDSIFKRYPFGSLLFWRARTMLKAERNLGPFPLPMPKDDYPIDYVLDGQQRITSLYATFQTGVDVAQDENWKDIFFDHSIERTTQEPQFFALLPPEVDPTKHFPMRTIYDSVTYRKATSDLSPLIVKRIDEMQSVFKEAKIPVQLFQTDDKTTVATIFERINRQGVRLDTLQLLSAWTWSEEFQLQNQFTEICNELEDFGITNDDSDDQLLLRCCSAVIAGDPAPESLVNISGAEVRQRFDEVKNGINGALDFLQSNCGVYSIATLPFQTMLVPLVAFFAAQARSQVLVSAEQRETLLKWFWRTAFSRRYSSGVLRALREDIKQAKALRQDGTNESTLGQFPVHFSDANFVYNNFNIRTVNTKTFVLLLASEKPISFISGTEINLSERLTQYNKTEFHHLMPRSFLARLAKKPEFSIDCLANFAFLSKSENNAISDRPPSDYRSMIVEPVETTLERAICPMSLFENRYDPFVVERAKMLGKKARILMRL